MNKRSLGLLIGFALFMIGAIALILSLVGLSFSFLRPLEGLGFLGASLVKGLMCISGIVIVYFLQEQKRY
ncbi:MAG: hypothetical protein IPP06_13235 [Saprospiraceae bacterium]|nr:hypothetical protein [Candidatus Vicinibacter affinis]MBP6174220.1 hypothetical protein [Saprospiraceae bacterium]MBK6572451.1 hypothetical protein [Candidatus Vicinibacter affinis]MBK6825255.1 hypothetical protein [Candidatus Vicinibacter affinis]MBK7304235.1 hypothetical protein [Candidatus Vicinibacter affinis]